MQSKNEKSIGCNIIGDFGGRGGARTPGLIVANDALSQLSYTPTAHLILANACGAAKRDCALDCYESASDFCASAITSAAFVASRALPCAKSFAPPPFPPTCLRDSRNRAPISCGRPFVCEKTICPLALVERRATASASLTSFAASIPR